MLVLTRERDDSIMIGRDIEIKVIWVRGNRVRLGIAAPRSVPVYRTELRERLLAAAGLPTALHAGEAPRSRPDRRRYDAVG